MFNSLRYLTEVKFAAFNKFETNLYTEQIVQDKVSRQ